MLSEYKRIAAAGLPIHIAGLVLFLCVNAPAIADATTAGDNGLSATLQASGRGLHLDFQLKNNSDHPIEVLPWQTPLEGAFTAPIFEVRKDGVPVDYIGPLVKRLPPTPSDYITIRPGDTVSSQIDLANGYAAYSKGQYAITFTKDVATKTSAAARTTGQSPQETARIETSTTLVLKTDRPVPPTPQYRRASYAGCTSSERATLASAHAAAESIAADAHNALQSTPSNARPTAPRYLEWFGDHTNSRYTEVTNNFGAIDAALSNQLIEFNCNCMFTANNYYAYVYPSNAYEIYICNAFWNSPLTPSTSNIYDSQAGTIVHEVSHFRVVADTDDHIYGQSGSRALAQSSPDRAVENADSYAYFAENTPPLGMSSGPGSCSRQPGDWDYCRDPNCGPCDAGVGDCDSDSECSSGLTCNDDVGADYGFSSSVDVCEAAVAAGDWNYCRSNHFGPCAAGEGDCDNNSECQSGLSCIDDVGANYGFSSSVDVCEAPGTCRKQIGDWDYCRDPNCGPCAAGEGDCDNNSECQSGLQCTDDVGSFYGFSSIMDVCEPIGGVCRKSLGDWDYCRDPACGPCDDGEGDCDNHSECSGTLICVDDIGADYGLASTVDICGSPNVCREQPGSFAYCADPNCGPCRDGEGDCDGDSECQSGLTCVDNVGTNYGWNGSVDVCETAPAPGCTLPLWDWRYCTDPECGPCAAGEGDCDNDSECEAGLVCTDDVGADYGQDGAKDACELPNQCNLAPWAWGYCADPDCGPCGAGEGDCDNDSECLNGLVCMHDIGSSYGQSSAMDVCQSGAPTGIALLSGQAVSSSVGYQAWAYYYIEAGNTDNAVRVELKGLSADIDLYVSDGRRPTTSSYDCRPYYGGAASETCTLTGVAGEKVYIGVHGYNAGSFTIEATLISWKR